MSDIELYDLLRNQKVPCLIEAYKEPLEKTVKRIFKELLILPGFKFVHTNDHRVTDRYIICSYLGESLRDVIADLENEHPIEICFNPTPDGGYEVSIEYKKEVEVIVDEDVIFSSGSSNSFFA